MKFSEIIINFKEKSRLTQEEIAEKLSTTKPTISNWCTGKRTPNVKDTEIINKISELTGTTVQEIVFAIIEQNHISLTPAEIVVNPFFKYFKSDVDLSQYLYDESESKILIIFQSDLFKNHYHGERNYIDALELFSLLSVLYGDATNKSLEELLKVETVQYKMNHSKGVTKWISQYLKKGHSTFDPRKLNNEELFEFLDCVFDLTQIRELLTQNLTEDGYITPFWNHNIVEYYGKKYVFSVQELLLIKNGNQQILREKYNGNGCYDFESAVNNYIKNYCFKQYDIIKSCVVLLSKTDDAEVEKYLQSYAKYQEELAVYHSKMEEIRKLQYLYDKEKYPDLPEPIPPEKPKEKYFYKLSKKGQKLLELYELTHKVKETTDKAPDYRSALESYKGTEITIEAIYGTMEQDNIILRDVYINDDYICDHLHIYRGNQLFADKVIGDMLFVKGTVYEYISSDGLKNLGLEVTEISVN